MADTPSLFSLVINGDVFTGTLHSPAEWNDKLAEELQLQELLIASFGHSSCCTAANTLCRVCDRPTLLTEAPAKPACSHAVCSACLTLYVDHILRRNVTNVRCPISACGAVLVPDAHRELVPPKLFHRWIQAHRADNWGGGRVTDDRTRVFQRGGGKWRTTLSMEGFPGEKPQRRDSSLQIFIQGEYDRDELLNLAGQALRSLGVDRNDPKGKKPVTEIGQASGSPEFYCNICMETKESSQRFDMGSCSHAFCGSCIGQYVATRVEEKVPSIGCPSPGCKEGILDPDKCRHVVSKEVFDRWGLALCESALGQKAFYCPYRDCSALLMNDCGGEVGCRATIKASCPHCRRICCAKCKVPWHWGIGCLRSLESGNETGSMEEHMLRDLAASKNWQRCPRCRIYVERIDGCSYMKCSCGRGFCYRCGSPMAADRRCNNCNIRSPF